MHGTFTGRSVNNSNSGFTARNYHEGWSKIILDDIIKRHQVDNVNVLKETFEFVCGNVTSVVFRKSSAGWKSMKVSITTIENYLSLLMSAYAIEN